MSVGVLVSNVALLILAFPNPVFSCDLISASGLTAWSPLHECYRGVLSATLSFKPTRVFCTFSVTLLIFYVTESSHSAAIPLFKCGYDLCPATVPRRHRGSLLRGVLLAPRTPSAPGLARFLQAHALGGSVSPWNDSLIALHLRNVV